MQVIARPLPRDDRPHSLPSRNSGSLRIGVNLFPLTTRGGGAKQYVLQLLPRLAAMSRHRYLLFHGPHGLPCLAAMLRRVAPEERRRLQTIEVERQEEIYAHAHRFDVFFCPLNALAPDLLDRPTVASLLDNQEQYYPQYFTPEQLALRSWLYPRTARAATVLLTISEFSKRCICEKFHVAPEKVYVGHIAPDGEWLHDAAEWPRQLPSLPKCYVFYPASLYPHKNHETLLRAIRILRERGIDCGCVLTGHATEPGTPIEERIDAHGLRGQVLWLGRVSPGALRHLYENALALCFPSEFEGFGMPLVEAMHHGCPVVATPVACIPEVVGDAALLVPPDAHSLADAIARLIAEPGLRKELATRGRARAAHFSARKLADITLKAFDDAVVRFSGPRREESISGRMTYIVRAFSGGPALARTLTSLCYEARDHDEVLVIGDRGRMCAKVLALCDNLESVRFLRNEDWIDEVGNETVCYLREGDQLREGATRAALDALGVCPTSIAGWAGHSCPAERDKSVPPTRPFRLDGPLAESPGWQAVVGEALAVNDRGTLQATRFVPPRSLQQLQTSEVPPAVVFWRRDFLREHRELLGKRFRPGPLLAAARGQVRVIERTLATVDTAVEARYDGPGFAWRLAASLARAVRRFPSAKRAAVKVLPRRLEAVLRGWYVWAVLPQHGRG